MKIFFNWFKITFTPLQQLLIIGFLARLVSVIFSKGFGFLDDHFLIIEASQSWVDGHDYNNWLPDPSKPERTAQGHPLFYVWLHYVFFSFCKMIGIHDPQTKMMLVRLIHAFYSLLHIKYGYKITKHYSNAKVAWYVGLFMALYWFMPFLCVRNLAEFVCVPPILIAIWLLIKPNKTFKNYFFVGLLFGIAFSIRFQIAFVLAGIGIALLINKTSFKNILSIVLSFFVFVGVTNGLVDFILWKKPFAEFLEYVNYNLNNAHAYGTDNWHMYFDLIFGLLVPPLSFLLFAGYFYTWKKIPFLFWPVLIYLTFHSYFPNKQERFVLTVFPLLIIAGTIGMFQIYERYKHNFNRKTILRLKYFVITLNCLLLALLSPSYGKRHMVESAYYFYNKKNFTNYFIEDSNKDDVFLISPLYYSGKWFSVFGVTKKFTADSALLQYNSKKVNPKPNYVIFFQAENINARVDTLRKRFPSLTYEATIEASLLDKTLHWLNPLNDNQTAYVYKIK
jgi:hypothetical protein